MHIYAAHYAAKIAQNKLLQPNYSAKLPWPSKVSAVKDIFAAVYPANNVKQACQRISGVEIYSRHLVHQQNMHN